MKNTVAKQAYSDGAQSLIDALETLMSLVPNDYDRTCINVEIAPHNDAPHIAGKAFLIEETLSDKSIVYNVEVY